MRSLILIILILLTLTRCTESRNERAEDIINQTIKAHGGHLLNNKQISFDFRDRSYSVTNTDSGYIYTRTLITEGDTIKDVLYNSKDFKRYINDSLVKVPDTMAAKYSNSVNSVLYFFQLPALLNDTAVNKRFLGHEQIKNKTYSAVKITFDAYRGGDDFEDEFIYWVNDSTKKVDYFAYNYQSDGGGVRFREVYDRINCDGIVFQNYVNYKAEIGTPLKELPRLYEAGQLEELSKIENKNIVVKQL